VLDPACVLSLLLATLHGLKIGGGAADPRFNTNDVSWDFIIVASEVTGITDRKRRAPNTPYGQITDADDIRIWALTWADVLDAAAHRLKLSATFSTTNPTPSKLAYLRRTHEKYLPEQMVEPAASS
jgi:hypothetical protein